MKKITLLASLLSSVFLLSACSTPSSTQGDNQRPTWIDHAQTEYPESQYLTAVGQASNRTRAGKNAVANLLEIFSVNVRAETRTLTEAVKQESALGVTMESSSTLQRDIQTETEQAIQGVEIKQTWLSPSGEYYALAVLHRLSASQNLTESIVALDEKTTELIDYSINQAPNAIASINALRSARDVQITRKMANFQLQYISGSGVPVDISSDKIEQLIKQKLAALAIAAKADTESQAKAIQSGLSSLGVQVTDNANIEVTGYADVTNPALIESWYWLRGSYELSLSENGQVISRKRWPIKVSAKQKDLLKLRLQDKLSTRMDEYLQQLISDSPSL
ncbi:LPP20 family lipoprotein [Psychromonas sp. KJ10-2]|uniref:LPP20 family lipoprotein n=1 Tax=Psychromonas sp. KJ10-2 TaxID=3391822 RepID=UPI0039B38B91